MSRVGILAGSFDPVHKGHVAFALDAVKLANLDRVYLLPEIQPRRKRHTAHVAHRLAMLELATRSHEKIGVMSLPDKQFSVAKTLPRIRRKIGTDGEVFFLMGADSELSHLPKWPLVERLLAETGLIVATRGKTRQETDRIIKQLPIAPRGLYVLNSRNEDIFSSKIRHTLKHSKTAEGILKSVADYADKNWVYSAVEPKSS